MNSIIPFHYEGIALKESCWIEGKPYFTYRAIGEFLEYENPTWQIRRLVKRNPYLLQFRTGVNLTPVEGSRNVTRNLYVFDPVGLQCIFFESHQPKAIQYKVAVANLVWALVNGKLKPSKWSQKGDLVSSARQILSLPEGRKRRGLVADLAKSEGCSLQHAYRRIVMATGERLKTKGGVPRKPRSEKGTSQYPEEKKKLLISFEIIRYI